MNDDHPLRLLDYLCGLPNICNLDPGELGALIDALTQGPNEIVQARSLLDLSLRETAFIQ